MTAGGLEGEGKDVFTVANDESIKQFEQEKGWSDPVETWTTGHNTHTHIYILIYEIGDCVDGGRR